CALRLPYW
nr:immunoglobulin heavy chain junction region [Mus musculus]